jgi:hypothetical protein
MDERPDVLREQIGRTRAALDRHLDDLGDRFADGKDRLVASTQWWVGVSAVAAGAIGTALFWPRRRSTAQSAPRR